MNHDRNRKIAESGEDKSALYFQSLNYQIVSRNFYSAFGEIDIVCLYQDTLIFCEVKTRTSTQLNHEKAMLSVSLSKQEKIKKTAQSFLTSHPEYDSFFTRFDVISILYYSNQTYIKHIKDAFR